MIRVRHDLIAEELSKNTNYGFAFHKFNLHNGFINKLHNHYLCSECCTFWYDSEFGETDNSYLYDMAQIYSNSKDSSYDDAQEQYDWIQQKIKEVEDKYYEKFTWDKAKKCFDDFTQAYKLYDESDNRLETLNWIDNDLEKGWINQQEVDILARNILRHIRKIGISKERLYIAYKDDEIKIYWYGRDLKDKCDHWMAFKRRPNMKSLLPKSDTKKILK